jgi:hypothetical protein
LVPCGLIYASPIIILIVGTTYFTRTGKHGVVQRDALRFSFPCIWIVLFEMLTGFLPIYLMLAGHEVRKKTDFLGGDGYAPQKWEGRALLQVPYSLKLDMSGNFTNLVCLHV